MKKFVFLLLCSSVAFLSQAQVFRAGVFDIDLMVQAMPGYSEVDSLVQVYERDSLGSELEYNRMEWDRLDSTFKSDSALVAQGVKSKALLEHVEQARRNVGINLVYWQQIAQNKSNNKRGRLAQPLYEQVAGAYKKVLAKKKYNIILKPQTYEAGFPIDNLFLSVARELKLSQLPQELLYLGDDPDVNVKPASKPATGAKPK